MTGKPPRAATVKKSSKVLSVNRYAVQCNDCLKWRSIDTEQEYMHIRSQVAEEPFVCGDDKSGVSCKDPVDIEMKVDASHMWVTDSPGIPRTPEGFTRIMVPRRDYSKIDVYYLTPTGKRVKCFSELKSFLEKNSDYQHLSVNNFVFTSPKIVDGTISKWSANGSSKKG